MGVVLIHAARRLKGVSPIRLVGLHKTTQNQATERTAQDLLHLGPPEYKDYVLPTRQPATKVQQKMRMNENILLLTQGLDKQQAQFLRLTLAVNPVQISHTITDYITKDLLSFD